MNIIERISKLVYLYQASKGIPVHVLKEMSLKQLLKHLKWSYWFFQQKEVKEWMESNDWGDPFEIQDITNKNWNGFSLISKRWIENIYMKG